MIFLPDFYSNLSTSPKKSGHFIKDRGWLGINGSIPTLGIALKYAGIFRLARLRRLSRITRLLRGKNKEAMFQDFIELRSRYALLLIMLLASRPISSITRK